MRGALRPTCSFARRFDRIANVFAVSERSFAEQLAVRAADFHAVAGIRPRLLAANVKLNRPVNCKLRFLFWRVWQDALWNSSSQVIAQNRGANLGHGILEPCWFQIFQQTFSAAFASEAALAISAETASRVEQVGAVDP